MSVVSVGAEGSLGDAVHAGLRRTPAEFIALSIPGFESTDTTLPAASGPLLNRHIDMATSNSSSSMRRMPRCRGQPRWAAEAPHLLQAGSMLVVPHWRRSAVRSAGRALPHTGQNWASSSSDVVRSVATKVTFDEAIEGSLKDALEGAVIPPPIASAQTDSRESVSASTSEYAATSVTDALDRADPRGHTSTGSGLCYGPRLQPEQSLADVAVNFPLRTR